MSPSKSIHTIVLDAGPILQNHPAVSTLLSKSEALVTTPSVTSEIKDVNARNLFDTTLRPFLEIRTPSALSVTFVTDFARKTGDLAVLSKPDVHVIALAYELDCQRSGGDWHLRRTPGQKAPTAPPQHGVPDVPKDSKAPPVKTEQTQASAATTAAPWAKFKIPSPTFDEVAPEDIKFLYQVDSRDEHSNAPEPPADAISESFKDLSTGDSHCEPDPVVGCDSQAPLEESAPPPQLEDSSSEDSEGWITPSNIGKVQAAEKSASSSTTSPETTLQVAIITNDFAMQNVILQIGLNLLAPNLQRIRNIRNYVLRCHACFQILKDTSKQFCSRCGKTTLTRVSCSTNAKGEFRIHLKKNMQWNHRGDRYSIPKPVPGQANGKVGKGKGGGKGGWGQELVLAEDQKEYQRALGVSGRARGTDLLDDNYLPGILTGDRGRAGGRPKVGAGRNVNSKKRT